MLNLKRSEGESIVIPRHRIEITVKRIEGNRVMLGIKAPHETEIYRQEIWNGICFDHMDLIPQEDKSYGPEHHEG